MTDSKRRLDWRVLTFAGVMAALVIGYGLVLGLAETGSIAGAPPGSTFNAGGDGAQALLAYLEGMDVEVDTLRQFEELPDEGTIVFIAEEPLAVEATAVEGRRLRDWAESGGRVVLIGPYARDVFFGTSIGIDEGPAGAEARMRPVQAGAYAQGVEEAFVSGERLLPSDPAWVAHLKDANGSALASRSIGEGEIVWLASMGPATNDGIGRGGQRTARHVACGHARARLLRRVPPWLRQRGGPVAASRVGRSGSVRARSTRSPCRVSSPRRGDSGRPSPRRRSGRRAPAPTSRSSPRSTARPALGPRRSSRSPTGCARRWRSATGR